LTCGPPVGWRAIGGAALGGAQSRLKSDQDLTHLHAPPSIASRRYQSHHLPHASRYRPHKSRSARPTPLRRGPVLRWRSLLHCLCPSRNQVQVAAMLVLSGCVTRGVRHHRVLETDPGCVVIAVLW
jgi:hypothetical protein